MKSLVENAEEIVDKLRKAEAGLTDELRLSTGLFGIRRELQAHIGEHHKAGDRIAIRKEFEIKCEVCGAVQANEDEYYLHLRKAHSVSEADTVEKANAPRTQYEGDIQELRRLMAEYTDADTEDDFTRDPVEN